MGRGRKMREKLAQLETDFTDTLVTALKQTAANELDLLFSNPDLTPYPELRGREPEVTRDLIKQGEEVLKLRKSLNISEIGGTVYLFEQACRQYAHPGPQTPGPRNMARLLLKSLGAE